MQIKKILLSLLYLTGIFALTACRWGMMGPTVQQIQSDECVNSIYAAEWACIKQRMASNPRHQMPSLQDEVSQYKLYGNKLEEAVAAGAISDAEASMKIMDFANLLDRRIMAERQVMMRAIDNAVTTYNNSMAASASTMPKNQAPVVYRSNATGTYVYGSDGTSCRITSSGRMMTCQ